MENRRPSNFDIFFDEYLFIIFYIIFMYFISFCILFYVYFLKLLLYTLIIFLVIVFATTCAINVYHIESCEFESRSWRGVLDTALCDKVCQWLAVGRWFFSRYSSFLHQYNWLPRHSWTIVSLNAITTLLWYKHVDICYKYACTWNMIRNNLRIHWRSFYILTGRILWIKCKLTWICSIWYVNSYIHIFK